MRTKKILTAIMAAILVLGAVALVGCNSSKKSIAGEWKVENDRSGATYVITDDAITSPAVTIPYKLGDDGAITLFAGNENQEVDAKYELSEDGKKLTIIETMSNGSADSTATPTEIRTVFVKVSDNKDAKPSEGKAPATQQEEAPKEDASKEDTK